MNLVLSNVMADGRLVDVRIADGLIDSIEPRISRRRDDEVIDGQRATLLPGLHDPHIHLLALAASLDSVLCGPPAVNSAAELRRAFRTHAAGAGAPDWIRGIGYHESVAGELDRHRLDELAGPTPTRVQHRSGSLWMLNSAAIDMLGLAGEHAPAVERDRMGEPTGRVWRGDDLLREHIGDPVPKLAPVGVLLARAGVTHCTDATHTNDPAALALLADAKASGHLPQHIAAMGPLGMLAPERIDLAHVKIVLDDRTLPDPDTLAGTIAAAHAEHRGAAIHCVTVVQLALAISALKAVGVENDRIEHGSVAPPDAIAALSSLGVRVVTQPGFIFERGDDYLRDVDEHDQAHLYPLRSLIDGKVSVAGSTDAPFSRPDPWMAMRAAIDRRTRSGAVLTAAQGISPVEARGLFISPEREPLRRGALADLVLASASGSEGVTVAMTIIEGRIVWESV